MIRRADRNTQIVPESLDQRDLTDRQREVLEICERYLKTAGEPCSVRYLARRLQIHPSSVEDHLLALHRKGWLRVSTTPRRRV